MSDQADSQPTNGSLFMHRPHPRIHERKQEKPATTGDERLGVNGRIGVFITSVVGTMWCAYAFVALSFYGLPTALSGGTGAFVQWASSQFIQLVLLPIIIVGQNVQSAAADKRSAQTYKDAEAILQECLQLQAHLQAQDQILDDLAKRLRASA